MHEYQPTQASVSPWHQNIKKSAYLFSLSVYASVSDVQWARSRWLHINLRPQSEQRGKAQGRDLVSAPPTRLPCGLPLYMTSEPLDSLAQLWPSGSEQHPGPSPPCMSSNPGSWVSCSAETFRRLLYFSCNQIVLSLVKKAQFWIFIGWQLAALLCHLVQSYCWETSAIGPKRTALSPTKWHSFEIKLPPHLGGTPFLLDFTVVVNAVYWNKTKTQNITWKVC